jgi:tetratricopeptide (TPR) repeat protein/glycosyltransferase involved in cell wall biosynthesis
MNTKANATANMMWVSAIVSTYNCERFMRRCLQDLVNQTLYAAGKVEIIVVDSGSPQNEGKIVREFQNRFPNIRYLRTEEREGVYAAWNRGIKIASGKYITNANTDDRHRRDAFERMVSVLEMKPEVALVYADVLKTKTENQTFDTCSETGRFSWYDWDRKTLLTQGCFMGPQPMWRRSVHNMYGYFDENLVTSGDYEFWLRISQSFDFCHIRMPLGLYLERPDSIEHLNAGTRRSEDAWIQRLYQRAAEQSEIIRCIQPDTPKAVSNRSRVDRTYRRDVIGAVDPLVGRGQISSENRQKCRNAACQDFAAIREQFLSGARSPQEIREFRDVSSAQMARRENETTKPHSPNPSQGEGRRKESGGRSMRPHEKMYDAIQPLMEKSDVVAAIGVLKNVIAHFPDFARGHNDIGVLYFKNGEKQKASSHYERAVALDPQHPVYNKNLADFYFVEQNQPEDALQLYLRVLDGYPQDIDTLMVAAHLCVVLYKFDDARVFYQRVLEIDPGSSEARSNLTQVVQIAAAGTNRKSPEELYAEAAGQAGAGNHQAALSILEKLVAVQPDHALAHNDLGVLLYQVHEKDKALAHYDTAVKLEPSNLTFQKNLAECYWIGFGRLDDALSVYVNIIAAYPEDAETLLAIGCLCDKLEKFDDAVVFYQRVLEIDPSNVNALARLGLSSAA